MKTYALLRLEHNANKVIFTCRAESAQDAAIEFNKHISNAQLDEDGYCKFSETVTFCVAEQWEPCHQVN